MEERRSCAANLLSQDVAPHNGRSSASQFAAFAIIESACIYVSSINQRHRETLRYCYRSRLFFSKFKLPGMIEKIRRIIAEVDEYHCRRHYTG